jgi:hypothetical protein
VVRLEIVYGWRIHCGVEVTEFDRETTRLQGVIFSIAVD